MSRSRRGFLRNSVKILLALGLAIPLHAQDGALHFDQDFTPTQAQIANTVVSMAIEQLPDFENLLVRHEMDIDILSVPNVEDFVQDLANRSPNRPEYIGLLQRIRDQRARGITNDSATIFRTDAQGAVRATTLINENVINDVARATVMLFHEFSHAISIQENLADYKAGRFKPSEAEDEIAAGERTIPALKKLAQDPRLRQDAPNFVAQLESPQGLIAHEERMLNNYKSQRPQTTAPAIGILVIVAAIIAFLLRAWRGGGPRGGSGNLTRRGFLVGPVSLLARRFA